MTIVLTCREVTELSTDYLEGALSVRRGAAFRLHLALCRHCRAFLRQMRLVARVLRVLPPPQPPVEVELDLLRRFRQELPAEPRAARKGSAALRLLAALEVIGAAGRAWRVIGTGGAVLALYVLLSAGPVAEIDNGTKCLAAEVAMGSALAGLAAALAVRARAHLAVGSYAIAAASGGAIAFAVLEATCSSPTAAHHTLIFHVGGLLLASLLVAGAARLRAPAKASP